mmetsp:Transcript_90974/g.253205  ORF Transcript_90974/g.253205 Transcript_90974/m.253205 type:complete len:1006 (-) Transcript_90974:131-3148(-)
MKRSLDPFRAVPLLNLDERAESLACTEDALYIGTAQGNLLQYDLSWGGEGSGDAAASARRSGMRRLSPKRPVEQVHAFPGLVVVLVDGGVSILPSDIESFSGSVLCREAKLLCPRTGLEARSQGPQREICVSFRKKLVLYAHNGRSFEQRQEFQAPEAACALVWHQSWICAGFRREYTLYNDRNGVPRQVRQFDGKFAPQITLAGNELLLLAQENIGAFLNLGTQQLSPGPVTWPRKVVRIGSTRGYVLGSTGQGQIDVFSVRDHRNVQTLTLEGATVAICGAACGRVFIMAETSITCLDSVPFKWQMHKQLMQLRVSDALDLLNATFDPDDAERERQLNNFHCLAGWALFRDLQFLAAFQHFLYSSEASIAQVLVFWRSYLPARFDPEVSMSHNALRYDEMKIMPCDIRSFIRMRLQEKQPSDGANEAAVSANMDLANAGMVSFLLKHRGALLSEERLPPDQRVHGDPDPGPLLQAVDTVLLKLLIETDQDDLQLQEVLDSGMRCAVEDCEAILREKNRIDVLARLWKEHGMYELVLREWSVLLEGAGKSDNAATRSLQHISQSQIVSEMCSALRSASSCQGGAELLRRYAPGLLAIDSSAVLPVFTSPPLPGCPARCPLKADEVLRLLQGHDSAVLGYLEHLVSAKRDVEPHHCAQLALIYIFRVAEEQKSGSYEGSGMSPARQKLIQFLAESDDLDARDLLSQVEALGLHEERVVLHCREQQHQEALRILVEVLNDLPRAEVYCRVVMAQRHRRPAASAGPGVVDTAGGSMAAGAMVFCTDPPNWARAIVFVPRRAGDEEESSAASVSSTAQPSNTNEAGIRPLMLFLLVLLDASVGAEQRPGEYRKVAAEYREAALSLLTGYAGHGDLPPSEVIGMLPAEWTLESLGYYLSKCARIGLHERRASMFEKSLSSMAYLKTFSALAHERSRKVTITGDRCCPVCTRRFVDKDSVGKAFVAYPNETCVHLQCKEDLSVCPKTGVSFADNLSVYCNALGSIDDTEV